MKTIIQSDWTRLFLGGVCSGIGVWALTIPYPQLVWIAIPTAALIGAISCFAYEHMVEAVVKAIIAGTLILVSLHVASRLPADEPVWWKTALIAFPIGFLGGLGMGGLLGAFFRLFRKPYAPDIEH